MTIYQRSQRSRFWLALADQQDTQHKIARQKLREVDISALINPGLSNHRNEGLMGIFRIR